jgi:hypothetical protein
LIAACRSTIERRLPRRIRRRVSAEPREHLGMLVGGIVVEDRVGDLAGRHRALDGVQKRMNSWWRWRCMQRLITVPSSTSSAANSVVVPLRF